MCLRYPQISVESEVISQDAWYEFCFLTLWDEGECLLLPKHLLLKTVWKIPPDVIFQWISSKLRVLKWESSKRMVPQNTHKVDSYKSSDNLISCTPLVVCSMGFVE